MPAAKTSPPWVVLGLGLAVGLGTVGCSALGQLGGGRTKLTGVVYVVMLPTLASRKTILELTQPYGHVVIDECHILPQGPMTTRSNRSARSSGSASPPLPTAAPASAS